MIKKISALRYICQEIKYVLPEKMKLKAIGLAVMILLGAIFEMLGVSVIVPLIQVILSPETLYENPYFAEFLREMHVESPRGIILLVGIGTVIVYIVKNLYMTLLSFCRVRFASRVQLELSVSMMKAYLGKGYAYFLNTNTGDLMRGIQNDTEGVYQVLLQGMRILTESFSIFCIGILIFIIDWKMALCIIAFAAAGFLMVSASCRKYLQRIGTQFQMYNGIVNSCVIQVVQGIKEVIIMNRQDYFASRYENGMKKRQKIVAGQVVAAESPAYLIEAVCVSGMILVVCLNALSGGGSTEFISGVGAFGIAAFRILPSTGKITNYMNNFLFYCPSLNSVYENIKNNSLNIEKNDSGWKENVSENHIEFRETLKLENIDWHYPDSEKYILKDFDLNIAKGESVGIVGPSGSGKTTFVDIILGLLTPQKGKILLDGKDISEVGAEWHQLIGYVPQNIYLMDDTLRKNVAFGVEDSRIDDRKVWKALEMAQLKDSIEKMPDGIDTRVGDRGIRFSGGQRQRIAIARALYNDPDILVLDEATSALDSETESAVMDAIELLRCQKTLIIIAHRLTTIQNCDVIYEISDGKAVKKEKKEIGL